MRSPAKSLGYVGDQVNWSHPQARGLVGYWPLNDGAGIVARDLVGRNNGALVGGPTWSAGNKGAALSFDGSNNHVDTTNRLLNDNSPFSYCAGINFAVTQSSKTIISRHNDATGGASFGIDDGSANKIKFHLNSYTNQRVNSTITLNDGKWHQVTGTWDGSALRLYIDGSLNATANVSSRLTFPALNTQIGRWTGGGPPYQYFLGMIADVRIYNRALTNTEIRDIYLNPTAIYRPRSLILLANALMAQPPIYIGGQRISKMMLGGNEVSGAAIGSSRFW